MKIAHSHSIAEAIDSIEEFLECDLYSKFRPEEKIPIGKNGKVEKWYREDVFYNEGEFIEYIRCHFNILRKEIIKGIGKKKFSAKFKSKEK